MLHVEVACGSTLECLACALLRCMLFVPVHAAAVQVKEACLAALHTLTTASPTAFQSLRSLPGSSDALAAVSAAYGNSWYSSKAALAGLNARLAAADAADAAAAAPIAGDVEELVEVP